MRHTRVQLHDDGLHHVVAWQVFMDSSQAALCGKTPWPSRWTEAKPGNTPVCIGCMNKARNHADK